jgi:gluconokinase
MPASLLHSQFETLEPPMPGEPVITVDAGDLPEVEVQKIIDALGLFGARAEPGTSS